MTDPLEHPLPPATGKPAVTTRSRSHVVLVLVIVGAIIGVAWLIGERNDFSEIGTGGINTELLPNPGEVAPELVTFDTSGRLVRISDFR